MWMKTTGTLLLLFIMGCTNNKFEVANSAIEVNSLAPKNLSCTGTSPANREVVARCFNNQEKLVQNYNVSCSNGQWTLTPTTQNSFTCPVQNCLNGLASPAPKAPTLSACRQGIGNITTNYSR